MHYRDVTPLLQESHARLYSGDANGSSGNAGGSSGDTVGSSQQRVASGDAGPLPPLILSRESKAQLAVLLGSAVVLQAGIGAIIPCLPTYAASVGLTASDVGLIVAVPAAARACLNLPAGRVADVLGRKRPWIFGALLDGVGCLATAAAGGLQSMVAARVTMGAGSAIAGAASGAYAMDVVARFPHHKGRLLGFFQAAGAMAFIMGPMVGGMLAEQGGVAVPFVAVGACILGTVPAVHLLLPETKPPTGSLQSLKMDTLAAETKASFMTLLRDPNQRALMLVTSALFTSWSASLTILPLYASSTWGASPSQLGFLYSVAAVSGLIGAPAGGYMADRVARKPAILLGAGVCASSFLLLPAIGSYEQLMACMFLMGLGESFLMSAASAASNDVTPAELRGAQSALISQVGDVTFVVMPITLTALTTAAGYPTAFLTTTGLIVGASIGFARLARLPPTTRGA